MAAIPGWLRVFPGIGLLLLALLAGPGGVALARENRAEVTGLVYTPSGRAILSASHDGYLRDHDPSTARQRRKVLAHEGGVFGLALSSDGKWLVTAGADHLVRLWDATSLKEVRVFRGHTGWVVGVAISPDGKWIASGGY